MENDFQVEQDQPNFWVGLIVAIVLGLAGSVVWAFVYLLGYIAWIVAFFMIFIMAWGYKKFNLKMDVKGYVLITIFAILETLLALVFVMAFLGMSEEVSFGEAFLLSSQENVTGDVIIDLKPYRYILVGVNSDFDLMKTDFGEYGEISKGWTADDVKGFTKILGNQMKIYHNIQVKNGKQL